MITVVVADDQELVRTGLCLILQAQDDIEVVADVADGRAAPDAVRRHHPDVALPDVRMAVTTGLEAARAILEGPGPTRVVMLTTFDDDSYLYDALSAGASGFLLKSSPRAHLLHAVRSAVEGEALLDSALTRRLVQMHLRGPRRLDAGEVPAELSALSPRELEVFRELAPGGLEHPDRREPLTRRDHGEDPRGRGAAQARAEGPYPGRGPGLRERTGGSR